MVFFTWVRIPPHVKHNAIWQHFKIYVLILAITLEVVNHLIAITKATNKDISFKHLIFRTNYEILFLMHYFRFVNYFYKFNHTTIFAVDAVSYVLRIVFFN